MSHRHRCEVRHCLRLAAKGKQHADAYIALVEKRRGATAAIELRKDAKAQWIRGSRGEWGDWRESD